MSVNSNDQIAYAELHRGHPQPFLGGPRADSRDTGSNRNAKPSVGERLTQEQLEGVPDKFEVDPEYHAPAVNGGTLMDDELLAQRGPLKKGEVREARTMETKIRRAMASRQHAEDVMNELDLV